MRGGRSIGEVVLRISCMIEGMMGERCLVSGLSLTSVCAWLRLSVLACELGCAPRLGVLECCLSCMSALGASCNCQANGRMIHETHEYTCSETGFLQKRRIEMRRVLSDSTEPSRFIKNPNRNPPAHYTQTNAHSKPLSPSICQQHHPQSHLRGSGIQQCCPP